MEVALAALADAANVSREGKLNLTGIFDTIWCRSFPVVHPLCVFAFRLRFEYEDKQKDHHLDVSLLDADGQSLWRAGAAIRVGDVAPGQFAHADHILTLTGVTFAKPGRYRFRIQIRGQAEPFDTVFQVVARPADASAQ